MSDNLTNGPAWRLFGRLIDHPEERPTLALELFKGVAEREAFKFFRDHRRQHGVRPSRQLVAEKCGVALPEAQDSASVYVAKLRDRHGHQTIKQGVIDAQDALNGQDSSKALDVLRLAVKAVGAVSGGEGTSLASIATKPLQPLWPGVLWFGKLTMVAGDAGIGKSTMSADVIARTTTGKPFPCELSPRPARSVLVLNAEDDAADTLRPRLEAAGADLSRVIIRKPGDRWLTLQDLDELRSHIERYKVGLLVLDPITAYLGDIDSHRTADVRSVLGPLSEMLGELGCACLAISHPNKDRNARALNRVTGSQAMVDATRATFLVLEAPDDPQRRMLLPSKNNLSADKPGFAFRLVDKGGHPAVEWASSPIYDKPDDVLAEQVASKPYALEGATAFLTAELANGPKLSKELAKSAKECGIAWRTLERAKKAAGIPHHKTPDGWAWGPLPKVDGAQYTAEEHAELDTKL